MILWMLHYVYRVWFDYDNYNNILIRRLEKIPKWYPLRNYSYRRAKTGHNKWEMRFTGCLMAMFTILILCIALIELVYGDLSTLYQALGIEQ